MITDNTNLRESLKTTALLAALLLSAFSAKASDCCVRNVHEIQRLDNAPSLDGVMDEDSWKDAKKSHLIMKIALEKVPQPFWKPKLTDMKTAKASILRLEHMI